VARAHAVPQARQGAAETAINNPGDLPIGKRPTNLPARRRAGFSANRRLLGVQRLHHSLIRAAKAFTYSRTGRTLGVSRPALYR
jgi:hypothetical protein